MKKVVLFTNSQAKLEYRDDLKIYGSVYSGNDWQDIYSEVQPWSMGTLRPYPGFNRACSIYQWEPEDRAQPGIVHWVWNFPMTQIFILGQTQINPSPWGQKYFWMRYGFLTVSSPIQRSQSSMDQAAEILAYALK